MDVFLIQKINAKTHIQAKLLSLGQKMFCERLLNIVKSAKNDGQEYSDGMWTVRAA